MELSKLLWGDLRIILMKFGYRAPTQRQGQPSQEDHEDPCWFALLSVPRPPATASIDRIDPLRISLVWNRDLGSSRSVSHQSSHLQRSPSWPLYGRGKVSGFATGFLSNWRLPIFNGAPGFVQPSRPLSPSGRCIRCSYVSHNNRHS